MGPQIVIMHYWSLHSLSRCGFEFWKDWGEEGAVFHDLMLAMAYVSF